MGTRVLVPAWRLGVGGVTGLRGSLKAGEAPPTSPPLQGTFSGLGPNSRPQGSPPPPTGRGFGDWWQQNVGGHSDDRQPDRQNSGWELGEAAWSREGQPEVICPILSF